MGKDQPYSAILVAGRVTVVLRGLSVSEDEHELELRVDGQIRGRIFLRPWCLPRLAVDGGELLLWGGRRCYFLTVGDGPVRRFDLEDEIHGAYRLPTFWCLICETSVLLWSSAEGVGLAECHHNEILLGSWWRDERLIVVDFQHRIYEVEIDERDLQIALRPCPVEERDRR